MGRAVRCGGGLDVLFTACGRHANYNMVKGLTSLMRRPTFSPFPVPSPRSLSLNRAPAGVRAHNSQREATRKKKKKKLRSIAIPPTDIRIALHQSSSRCSP